MTSYQILLRIIKKRKWFYMPLAKCFLFKAICLWSFFCWVTRRQMHYPQRKCNFNWQWIPPGRLKKWTSKCRQIHEPCISVGGLGACNIGYNCTQHGSRKFQAEGERQVPMFDVCSMCFFMLNFNHANASGSGVSMRWPN